MEWLEWFMPVMILSFGGVVGFYLGVFFLNRKDTVARTDFDRLKDEKIGLKTRLSAVSEQLRDAKSKLESLSPELSSAREQVARLDSEKQSLQEQFDTTGQQLQTAQQKLDKQATELSSAHKNEIILNNENKNLQQHAAQYNKNLTIMKEEFRNQFENLANKIFDEKNQSFSKQSQKDIQNLLTPFKERFSEFQSLVQHSFSKQSNEQSTLKGAIAQIVETHSKMTVQTEGLTKALRGDMKAQGSWGEIALERILESSGLRKDADYVVQGGGMGLRDHATNKLQYPDVVVILPEKKHIIIDAKVSLVSYERYCVESDKSKNLDSIRDLKASVKAHINNLSKKNYHNNQILNSPEFVLMFMPIEGSYSLIMQEWRQMSSYAWDKKVVIVSPSTLFVTLRTIASVWRVEIQNQNVQKIAHQGGLLYDKVVNFIKNMEKIGKQLKQTDKTYREAINQLSQGRGNILRKTEELRSLGVTTSKKLPEHLIEPNF